MRRREVLKAALGATAGVGAAARASDSTNDARIRIGLTAVILADQVAFLSRWGQYLSVRTGRPVSFIARESYQGILDLLFGGQLEAAWICGYPYVLHQSRLQLLPMPLYQGKPLYQSYLIRPKGAADGITGWADLKGKVLAYSDPLSNSGWLVPRLSCVPLASRRATCAGASSPTGIATWQRRWPPGWRRPAASTATSGKPCSARRWPPSIRPRSSGNLPLTPSHLWSPERAFPPTPSRRCAHRCFA